MPDSCLSADAAMLFVAGELSADERRAAEAHLADCSACRDWLAELVEDDEAFLDRAVPAMGRYQISESIGEGAMGTVYRAFDPQLEREVALKLMRGGREEALLVEARALAQFSHPNLVHVYDVGQIDDEVFLAMELVDGASLENWLREDTRPWREVLDVLLQAGRGLAAMHSQGWIHRDFKPANVVVDREGRARLCDFGLVSASTESGSQSPGSGGTPRYMAPEQHLGASLDARCDQFSFALVAFESLFGRAAFAGESYEELRAEVLAGRQRTADSWAPRSLASALKKALSVDPAERYPSLPDLLAVLERHRTSPRRKWIVGGALASASVVAVVALFGGSREVEASSACRELATREPMWSADDERGIHARFEDTGASYRASMEERVWGYLKSYKQEVEGLEREVCAVTPREELATRRQEAALACLSDRRRGVRMAIERLGELDASWILSALQVVHDLPELRSCQEASPALWLGGDDAREGERDAVREKLTEARLASIHGDDARAAELLRDAADDAEKSELFGMASFALGELGLLIGHSQGIEKRVEAEKTFRRSLKTAEQADDAFLRATATVLLASSIALQDGREQEALGIVEMAESALAAANHPPSLMPSWYFARGIALFGRGDSEAALADIEKAGELARELLPERDPRILPYLETRAAVLGRMLRHEEASALLDDIVAEIEDIFGPESSRLSIALLNRAAKRMATARYEEATRDITRVQAILRGYAPEGVEYLKSLQIAGAGAYIQKDYEGALRSYGEARRILDKKDPPLALESAINWVDIGDVYYGRSQAPQAIEHYQRAVDEYTELLGGKHYRLALPLSRLGMAHLLEDPAAAIAPLERALAIYLEQGASGLETNFARTPLSRALWKSKRDRKRAQALAREAWQALKDTGPSHEAHRQELRTWFEEIGLGSEIAEASDRAVSED